MDQISNIDFFTNALAVRELQLQLTSSNLANQDTPNFKAKGVDFKTALSEIMSSDTIGLKKEHKVHYSGNDSTLGVNVSYINTGSIRADGNNVNEHLEKANFANQHVLYEAALTFSNSAKDSIKNSLKYQ